MRRHLALILGLLALCRAPSASAAKSEGVWVYTVKSGDTCWSIAQRFLGSGDQNARIHKLNRLGPMPHILTPGQQLRLPGSAPVADATIEWLRRDVRTKPPTSPEWRRAEIRQELWRLYKVATGDGSSAGIIFEDTSFLRLRESALLVIYGGSREKTKNRRLEKREIVVEKGIVRGGLAALYHNKRQPGDRLTLRTPSATVILRSPSSQVEVDEKKMSIVSVYRGNATVRAKGKEVDVPREFGTRVELGKRPEKPRPLPPPPRWSFTPYERVALVPKGGLGTVEAHWTAVPRAARYRVELARTPSFRQPMIDAVVGAGVRRFRATKLKPGVYYARVATIGSGKLEGKPSKRLKIHVIALASVPPLVPTTSGELVAPAFLRLSPPPRSSGVQLSVDGAAFRPFVDALRLRRPGTYRLRFRRLGSSWPVPELRIVILGVKAALEIRRTQLVPGQQAVFEAIVRDARGRPLVLPGLRLELHPGPKPIALQYVKPGHYRGVLTIAALPHGRAVARLSWAGGDLVDRTLQIEGPAPQKAPQPSPQKRESPTWDREPTPLVSEWVLPSPGLRPIRARPLTFVGFTTHVGAGRDAAGDQRRRTLRLAFHGELALLAGRLGLDIDLPWLAIDPGVNSAQRNKFGDLRLGLRTPVLDRRGVVLAVYLRSLFSTGDFGRPRNDQWLEPGLALDWRWRDRLLLNTTQTLAIGLNAENKPLLTWGSTYDAIVRVVRWFSLGTELSLQLGLTGPDNRYVAVAISGLLRFDLGRFRLDLFGGGGLNPEARRRLGEFQLGLAFGLLFGDVR